MSNFSAETYQNEYLAAGGEEVNAIVTITASGGDVAGAATADAAELVIVDVSGSMHYPRSKLAAAKEATAVAVDCIRDGVLFGVIAGTDAATRVYPRKGELAVAAPATRAEAKAEVAKLQAGGGTAIGLWLDLARMLLAPHTDRIRHAILLTDGEDQNESPEELDVRLEQCIGQFQCDCRGVGTDWQVAELRKIASALLGTVDIIAQPEGLAADFRAMIESAMGKSTADVAMRLWTPQGAEVAFVRQVAPRIEDLAARATVAGAQTIDFPTGAWGNETRDYHVCIRVRAREIGDEMLAARLSLIVDDEVVSQSLVKAIWTDDERLSTRISREVAHYTGQAELADAIQEGLEARKQGDEDAATARLGRAVQLAAAAGNDATMRLLERVVEIDDAPTGTVRLRREVEDADEMALDTRSTRTVRVGGTQP